MNQKLLVILIVIVAFQATDFIAAAAGVRKLTAPSETVNRNNLDGTGKI